MELQELRTFVAVVENNGFARASQKLGLTQSAISQSVANLERKLDTKVLERTIPVKPTAIGAELLQHAHFILDRESSFLEDLKKLKQGYLQTLSLAVDHLANHHLCPILIKKFSKVMPEIRLEIRKMPAREMIEAIKNGQCQLALGPFQKNMEGFKKVKLWNETSHLTCGKKSPILKSYTSNPLSSLNEATLLTSYLDEAETRPSRKKIRDYFKNSWEINDINLQIQLMKEGLGAAFISETILKKNPLAKNLMILDQIPFSKISKPYGLYYSQDQKVTESLSIFIDLVQNESHSLKA